MLNNSLLTDYLELVISIMNTVVFSKSASSPLILVDKSTQLSVKVGVSGAVGVADQHGHQIVRPGHHLLSWVIDMTRPLTSVSIKPNLYHCNSLISGDTTQKCFLHQHHLHLSLG